MKKQFNIIRKGETNNDQQINKRDLFDDIFKKGNKNFELENNFQYKLNKKY